MTFKSPVWRPIAMGLSALNLVGVGLAAGAAEPWHAGIHAVLALAFASWSQRLRRGVAPGERPAGLEELEADVNSLRGELTEIQERLDFTERMLAQHAEARRVGPEH
jgi:uncharacterized membrane protein YhiD involved in acid resistance